MISRNSKVNCSAGSLLYLRLYHKIPKNFVRLIFKNGFRVMQISFVRGVKSKFLAQFPVDHLPLPVMSSLILCANLLHSLIMWLIVSSLSPHNLYLLFRWTMSVFALTYLVLMTLFCAAVWRDSVSLLRLPFLSHVSVFLYDILVVYRLKCPYNCFSSHFCFLVIFVLLRFVLSAVFLVVVINLPPRFFMLSSNCCIDASMLSWMLVSPPTLFLDT